MTEQERVERRQLEELRTSPEWPRRLDRLAVQAAAIGRLHDSVENAEVGILPGQTCRFRRQVIIRSANPLATVAFLDVLP